jgi:hypothetical protein
MSSQLVPVDHGALRANQIVIIVLSITAFVLDLPWLAAFVAAVMLIGTALRQPGFIAVYRTLLKPAGLVKPEVLSDNPEPHRFSQGLGGAILAAGNLALFLGAAIPGWGLVWLVVALAALNAFGGFCVGCAMYYWLNRLNVPGFSKAPVPGVIPGMRPPSR